VKILYVCIYYVADDKKPQLKRLVIFVIAKTGAADSMTAQLVFDFNAGDSIKRGIVL
jgi:hypothetical protein